MAEEKQVLFNDCCGYGLEIELCESAALKGGPTKFRGKFQEAEAVNKNKRSYPYDVLDENVQKLQDAIAERRLIGELDHPTDSIVHFANASHIITRLWWEGTTLMGEGEILNTPSGMVLKALIDQGVRIGISSRGVGNGKVNEGGVLVIGEGYKLITFDAVADPSTHEAFQQKMKESVVHSPSKAQPAVNCQKSSVDTIKNENSSINTINKEVFIACMGGILTSHTNKIKTRLR